ncbi:MAG: type III-B CRISPR module-associated protein Cmr5 [Saprospiraceae bacterium]|nr:type III-B CRISPR module-associated protein Cmr5 [Saprospiraceae bacterium]
MVNIEQERAKAAFEFAKDSSKAYGSYVKKAPMYILNNGLTNFLAFAYSKRKDANWNKLYNDIKKWFAEKDKQMLIKVKLTGNNEEFVSVIANLSDEELRIVTDETLAVLSWLRRFVKSEE